MRAIILILLLVPIFGMEIVTLPGDERLKGGLVILSIKDNRPTLESHSRVEDVIKEYKELMDSGKITNVIVFRLRNGLKTDDSVALAARVMEEVDKVTYSYPRLDDVDETRRESFELAVVQIYAEKRK